MRAEHVGKRAPGIASRFAASSRMKNPVIASEYFSGFPARAANRRSAAAIRAVAASSVGDSSRYTHATRR